MQEEIKPIKRSTQLASLSRDHHDGLLFCWKIRQGLGNGTPLNTLRAYTSWYWKEHLRNHFQQEEDILLPYLDQHLFGEQLLKEHTDIRELIISLDKSPDANLFSVLASFVHNHIRFEERHLFNYLEKILSADQLDTVAQLLAEVHGSSADWPEPFWERKKKK